MSVSAGLKMIVKKSKNNCRAIFNLACFKLGYSGLSKIIRGVAEVANTAFFITIKST